MKKHLLWIIPVVIIFSVSIIFLLDLAIDFCDDPEGTWEFEEPLDTVIAVEIIEREGLDETVIKRLEKDSDILSELEGMPCKIGDTSENIIQGRVLKVYYNGNSYEYITWSCNAYVNVIDWDFGLEYFDKEEFESMLDRYLNQEVSDSDEEVSDTEQEVSDTEQEVSDTDKPEFYKIAKFEKKNDWLNSIGIISPFVAEETTLKTDNGTYPLYFIYDEAAIDREIYNLYSYIAIEKDSEILLFAVEGSYGGAVYTRDIDGDKCDEIILQQTVDMFGGVGQFRSTVFNISDDELEIIFTSPSNELFDTGFEGTAQDGFKLLISNRFTEYEKVISFADRKTHYIGVYYDETGKVIKDCRILCDSFCEFYPEDVDGDGVFELVCLQYVSLNGHTDHIGDAYSVLKFSNDTNQFEVVSCEFLAPKYE